jgi:hypothetical protein
VELVKALPQQVNDCPASQPACLPVWHPEPFRQRLLVPEPYPVAMQATCRLTSHPAQGALLLLLLLLLEMLLLHTP